MLALSIIKKDAMNKYLGVEVHLQEFLTSALPLSKWSASIHDNPTMKANAAVVIG
jgi:hypothetical protein